MDVTLQSYMLVRPWLYQPRYLIPVEVSTYPAQPVRGGIKSSLNLDFWDFENFENFVACD